MPEFSRLKTIFSCQTIVSVRVRGVSDLTTSVRDARPLPFPCVLCIPRFTLLTRLEASSPKGGYVSALIHITMGKQNGYFYL